MRILLAALVLLMFPAVGRADTAIFAGGNFWNMQVVFDAVPGVTNTIVGYTGGAAPVGTGYKGGISEKDIAKGHTGHRQAVLVRYDPARVKYAQLLNVFWRNIDPLDGEGQFCDKGPQFTTAIYYTDDAQKRTALDSRMLLDADVERMGGDHIATLVEKSGNFYAAQTHHQQYYLKNPLRYRFYTNKCGRDQALYNLWRR